MADSNKGSGHGRLAFWDLLTDVGVIAVLKKIMEDKGAKVIGGTLPTEDEALWQRVLMELLALTDTDGKALHQRAKEMFALLDGIGEQAFFLHVMQADYHRLVELYKTQTEKKDPLDELTSYVRQLLEAYPNPQDAANHVRETRGAVAHWITKVPDWGRKLLERLGLSEALSAEDAQRLGAEIGRIASTNGLDDLTAAIETDTTRRREAREAKRRERDGHSDDGDDGDGSNRPRRRRKRGGVWFATIYLIAAIAIAIIASNYDARHLMSGPTSAWQKAAEDAATSAAGAEAATGGSTHHWYDDSMFWLVAVLVVIAVTLIGILIAMIWRRERRSNGPDRDDDQRYGAARTEVDEEATFTDITN